MTVEDPFATPQPIASEFPSAASFRGRLILIEPTKFERQIPKRNEPGKLEDRITATVTVIDGEGDIQLCPQQIPSGIFVPGPEYPGIWFSQDRIVKAVVDQKTQTPLKMVLGRLETYKPGKPAREGNPWGLLDPSEADKQTARDFLAKRAMGQATAQVAAATPNPFAPQGSGAPF